MAINSVEQPWYLVQLKPNSHKIALRNLERQMFRAFLPMHSGTIRSRGKFRPSSKPLFPGYLFVSLDPQQGLWSKVNATRGVSRLVHFGTAPMPLPGGLVEEIMQQCDGGGTLMPTGVFEAGTDVVVSDGPFAGFVATVERMVPDQRVWVLLDLMGRRTRVAVDAGQLRDA